MPVPRIGSIACAQALALWLGGAAAQTAVTGPASAPAAAPSLAATSALIGRWVRPDGGYVITIRSVDAAGKIDAGYANPGPLPFYSAEAKREGGQTRLYFELRAGGYGGSTYRLSYDAVSDRLVGVYYQAVARQSYDVFFERAK